MTYLMEVIIGAPFAGAASLAIFGARMPKWAAGAIGCASVALSWLAAMVVSIGYLAGGADHPLGSVLYRWVDAGGLRVDIGLHLDALSLVMMGVITFVGFLIHLYASQSMYEEDGYSRFFAYMNLFVGAMLVLVLADNLLLLFLGWEGVGLCSYLLIGFWYRETSNGYAAQKAFIVTRVGDTAFMVALFVLFYRFGTLDIAGILAGAPGGLTAGMATLVALLLLGGAVGKSAQLPLQTWLPDAMAGPTPVSALIHAATMVTAGVYLIARMHPIFEMAPAAMFIVGIVGTATLLYASLSALVQRDIKRVLAYSTISQIGYMFLALGVGAWAAAMFHFLTHAFFKALLFLSAGVVIDAQHHEHDLFKMGGLRRELPVTCWTFFVGAASLSALPLVTAGFYSKDAILWAAYSSPQSTTWFWGGALLAALLTAIYSFRAWLLAFWGESRTPVGKRPGGLMNAVLVVLAVFSVIAGFVGWPELLLHFNPFGEMMSTVFADAHASHSAAERAAEAVLLSVSALLAIAGAGIAWLYFRGRRWAAVVERSSVLTAAHRYLFSGWGFDWIYDRLFVRPYRWLAYGNRRDFVDALVAFLSWLTTTAGIGLSISQTGRMRHYAAGIVAGGAALAAIILLR